MNRLDASIVLITWSPTERRLKFLKRTIDSVRAKAGYAHTLVVVDNGPKAQSEYLAEACPNDIVIKNKVNLGVGHARNQGAAATESGYIAFIDNDLEFVSKDWLAECIGTLEFYRQYDLIATPRRSHPMKGADRVVGKLDGYLLFERASPMCFVMRRSDFEKIGLWPTHSMPGSKYCDRTRKMDYRYIWHPEWVVKHLAPKPSYNFHNTLVNGEWVKLTARQEQIAHWDNIWAKKFGQYIKKHRAMYPGIKLHLKGRILDLGMGVTDMYEEGQDVTGVDVSSECIRIMTERHPWGAWLVREAMDTKLPANSFDTIVAANILEHYPDQAPIIREIKRMLKPGGTAVIVVPKANFSKGHIYPEWDDAMIKEKIGCHFETCKRELYVDKWWIIRGSDAKKET